MISVILAAGYATRLYPLTENFPKPLLEIGETTILGRLVDDLDTIPEIKRHIIVTNHKFAPMFEKWAQARCEQSGEDAKEIVVVDDGTSTNETRLGAVRDLILALDHEGIDDEDIMVLAADNILEFSLRLFYDAFKQHGTSMVMCHNEPSVDRLRRTGVIALDDDMRITAYQEKPAEPLSHWAVPPFYIYHRRDLPAIRASIDNGCGTDAPGSLARYISSLTPMHAFEMPAPRFDIGSLDTYHEAQQKYNG